MGALLDLALETDPARPSLISGDATDLPPLTPQQESARRDVLARLAANPAVRRAFVTRYENGSLIVTLALRDVGTCELMIPAERFDASCPADYVALLEGLDLPAA